jgi:mono/diheme cytochrome c family protein
MDILARHKRLTSRNDTPDFLIPSTVRSMRSRFLFVALIALAIAPSIAAFMKWNSQDGGRQTSVGPTGDTEGTVAQATYVGGQSCAACHKPEYSNTANAPSRAKHVNSVFSFY